MAYNPSKLYSLYSSAAKVTAWLYITTDAFATVSASNYFSDALLRRVNPGDSIAIIVFTTVLPDGELTGFASYTPAVFSGVTSSGGTVASVAAAGTMIYPNSGIAVSTGSAWGSSITLGTGVAAALAANVNGSGAISLTTSPTFVTPALGTPASGVLTNCTGTAAGLTAGNASAVATINGKIAAGTNVTLTGTGTAADPYTVASSGSGGSMTYPGAGIGNSTGSAWGTSFTTSGSGTVLALATSPVLTTPNIGTPSAGTLTNCSGLPISGIASLGTSVATALGNTLNAASGLMGYSADRVTDAIEFVIDGGGSAITTGVKGYIEVPYACTINRATLLADQSGSVVVDVFKCTYAQFDVSTHPVSGDKITASAPPTISSATKAQDSTLTGWTTSISAGDILAFNVNSATTVTRVTISLKVTK